MEQNKEIIRQLYSEVITKQKDVSYTGGHSFSQYKVSARPYSLKAFNQFFAAVSIAFPDYEFTIENMVAKGDRVMARYTISGTHTNNFMGIAATNEKMTIIGIDVFRLDKGRVVDHWDAAHQISVASKVPGVPAVPSQIRSPYTLVGALASGEK